jgi:hypothetical protein
MAMFNQIGHVYFDYLVYLLCLLSYLLTYLLSILPTSFLPTYQNISYLPTYIPTIYLPTSYLPIYLLSTYLPTIYLPTYLLSTYLPTIYLPTSYLPTYNLFTYLYIPMLNYGIWQPSYHQGKRLPNKKGTRKKLRTHENKTCLLSFYHLVITIIMQQLSSCTYCHLHI